MAHDLVVAGVSEKVCTLCGEQRPLRHFALVKRPSGNFRRHSCNRCWGERRYIGPKGDERRARDKASSSERRRRRRRNPARRANIVLEDSKRSDRRHGRDNDLELEFVARTLDAACVYCSATDLKMTLDRIDNSIGHLQGNCVAACIRCNYVRRDMPYETWLVVAVGMKQAREAGLFGTWDCSIQRHANVAQSAEATVSNSVKCQFNSDRSH